MDSSTGIPLGRYLLGEKLASGGMGEVYVAVQRGLEGFEKPLAIKLLLPHLIEESQVVKMFLDEARLCARMSHPNIVQILDLGLEEGRYFLAMELVHGVSLVRLVRVLAEQQRTLSAPLILHVARSLLDALHYAHTLKGGNGKPLGLVHRDVTPHNILVSMNGEVKLTDFGIAKVQAAVGQTRPGVVRGKMDYLAPEQLRFERLDSRVDLFAAGLTLIFMATGRSPFARSTTQETLKAVQHEPLPFLQTLRPDLPRALVEAIAKATEKEPNRRFLTARAFRDALPPPSAEERAEVLGALVREVCPAVMGTLDRASRTLAALNASARGGGPVPKAVALSLSEPVVGTLTERLSMLGTVAAPAVAEMDAPRAYTPRPVEANSDGTLPLEPPPPRSQRRRVWAAAAALGALTLVGLGVVGWMSRSKAGGETQSGTSFGILPQGPSPLEPLEPPKKAEEKPEEKGGKPDAPASDTSARQDGTPEEVPPKQLSNGVPELGGTEAKPTVEQEPPRNGTNGTTSRGPPGAVSRLRGGQPSPEGRTRSSARMGYLTVDALPRAQVIIAGAPAGETPLARISVPAGSVEVELRNPETGKVARRRVKVRAGKEIFVKEDLR